MPAPIVPVPAPSDLGASLRPSPSLLRERLAEMYGARSASALVISSPGCPWLPATTPTPVQDRPRPQSTPLCARPHLPGPTSCQTRQQDRSEEHTSELQSLRHLVC